jgi:hypothetical protein
MVFEILEGAAASVNGRVGNAPSPTVANADELQHKLRRSNHADLRGVRVRAHADVIRLSGRVRNFYAKQVAQMLVRHECQAGRIDNAIEVA